MNFQKWSCCYLEEYGDAEVHEGLREVDDWLPVVVDGHGADGDVPAPLDELLDDDDDDDDDDDHRNDNDNDNNSDNENKPWQARSTCRWYGWGRRSYRRALARWCSGSQPTENR